MIRWILAVIITTHGHAEIAVKLFDTEAACMAGGRVEARQAIKRHPDKIEYQCTRGPDER